MSHFLDQKNTVSHLDVSVFDQIIELECGMTQSSFGDKKQRINSNKPFRSVFGFMAPSNIQRSNVGVRPGIPCVEFPRR